MKLTILLAISCFGISSLYAQSTYTEKLRKVEAGKGTVVIKQSEQIEQIVNNTVPKQPNTKPVRKDTETVTQTSENKSHESNKTYTKNGNYTARGRHKARGYRICIFTGGNSRAEKTKALKMGEECRKRFGELSVYTSFIAPRWVTYVGDFKSRHDADKYVKLIRAARFTYETRIVSSEVNLPDE